MFDAFFITLREAAELFLCAEALRQCLKDQGLARLLPSVRHGLLLGLGLGCVALYALSTLRVDPRLGAIATIVFAAAMMVFAVGMLVSVHSIQEGISTSLQGWIGRACTPTTVVLFMAFVTARESIEVAVFLREAWDEVGHGDVVIGALAGMATSLLVLAAYRTTERRSRLFLAFRLSALVLAFVSVDLAVGGIADLVEAQLDHRPDSAVAGLLDQYIASGALQPWLYAALMAVPTATFIRSWWNESARC